MQSLQKDNQISDLKTQIKDNEETIAAFETSKVETPTNEEVSATITETVEISGGPYIENGYFYVPKWGVKYKLSDNLTNYGYAVDQESQVDSYGNYVIGLTAISKSDYRANPQDIYYNDIFSCSVVTIRAMENSKKSWQGNASPDIQFNGLNFVVHDIWRPQNCTNEYMASTDTVASQLKTILINPEKI